MTTQSRRIIDGVSNASSEVITHQLLQTCKATHLSSPILPSKAALAPLPDKNTLSSIKLNRPFKRSTKQSPEFAKRFSRQKIDRIILLIFEQYQPQTRLRSFAHGFENHTDQINLLLPDHDQMQDCLSETRSSPSICIKLYFFDEIFKCSRILLFTKSNTRCILYGLLKQEISFQRRDSFKQFVNFKSEQRDAEADPKTRHVLYVLLRFIS